MRSRYHFGGVLALLFVFLCTCVRAQTTVVKQSFENTSDDTWTYSSDPTPYSIRSGSDAWIDRTSIGASPNSITEGSDGGRFWVIRDLNNTPIDGLGGSPGPHELTFATVDVSNYTGVAVSFDYNFFEFDESNDDELGYEVFIDGASQGRVDLVETTGTGPNISSGGYQTLTFMVPDGARTDVSLVFYAQQDGGGDWAAADNFRVTGTEIVPVCDLMIDPADLRLFCADFTEGADAVTASIRYFGVEPGVTVTVSGGASVAADSDDPAVEQGGTMANARSIRLEGLTEGSNYTLTVAGGGCTGDDGFSIPIEVPATLCGSSDLVINELYASVASGDVEFVELYNNGTEAIDLAGFTVEEGAGVRFTFPTGDPTTVLPPGTGLVVYGVTPAPANAGCNVFGAPFLGLNDDSDEVIIRDGEGNIVAQLSYTAGPTGTSLALAVDGDLSSGYQEHTVVSGGAAASPCYENADNSIALPVELLHFSAAVNGKEVALDWRTSNEVDHAGFEVQRSASGAGWTTIGTVAASTGRSATNDYTFTDDLPLTGTSYYRLRQVDLDGTATLFAPVSVTIASGFAVFPNPAGDELRFAAPLATTNRVSLLGPDGKFIRAVVISDGAIGVSDLRPGLYLLRVVGPAGSELVRFVKR